MKKTFIPTVFILLLFMALPLFAADIDIKGDFNNRFMIYTNHNDWLKGESGTLDDGNVEESWGEAKYRLWLTAATNDGKVKGVCAF
ncbi:MAG: hypothetical protein JXO49_00020 [Deltaproteobacteria bacterium]|nr:hypothetical protein [Candidatus Anaeroferrophillus wilburensis]MBN2887709.1 hypothetical protein [Deltaproteobacteria bacterium]